MTILIMLHDSLAQVFGRGSVGWLVSAPCCMRHHLGSVGMTGGDSNEWVESHLQAVHAYVWHPSGLTWRSPLGLLTRGCTCNCSMWPELAWSMAASESIWFLTWRLSALRAVVLVNNWEVAWLFMRRGCISKQPRSCTAFYERALEVIVSLLLQTAQTSPD